jgi:hypothetical protein
MIVEQKLHHSLQAIQPGFSVAVLLFAHRTYMNTMY